MAAKLPIISFPCLVCRSSFQSNILTQKTQVAYKWAVRNQNRKNSKTDFAAIQLLRKLPTYGEKGTFMQVPRGVMRSTLYPKQHARYVVGDELKELQNNGTKFERDRSFMVEMLARPAKGVAGSDDVVLWTEFQTEIGQQLAEKVTREEAEAKAQAEEEIRLEAEEQIRRQKRDEEAARRTDILERALPKLPEIIRLRYVIERAVNAAAATFDQNGVWKTGSTIFGSVTPADLLVQIRESMSTDEDTAALVIEEEHITFTSTNEADPTKLKSLGSYQVSIGISGSDQVLSTTLDIVPDSDSVAAGKEARKEEKKKQRPVFAKENPSEAFSKKNNTRASTTTERTTAPAGRNRKAYRPGPATKV